MHERIAKALGWTVEQTHGFSLAALRDLVRPVDPALADEISRQIQSGSYIRSGTVAADMSWLGAPPPVTPDAAPVKKAPGVKRVRVAVKDPRAMTAGEINRELDKLDAGASVLNSRLIEAGRGSEKYSETMAKTDPLALAWQEVQLRIKDLRWEITQRYGPDAPSRLPAGRGFGPRI